MKKIFYFFLLFLTCYTTTLFSQKGNWKNYNFRQEIKCIAYENDKAWVGAKGGLLCMDMNGEILLSFDNTNAPLGSIVEFLQVDSKGNKWLGTDIGLVKFDNVNWTVFKKENSGLPYNSITCMAMDKKDNLWIGTREAYNVSLSKFDGTTWVNYDSANSGLKTYNQLNAIAIDTNGVKWIATQEHGVFKYNDTTWTNYHMSNSGIVNNYIWTVACDKKGNVWLGSRGISKFDGTTWKNYVLNTTGLGEEDIRSITIDGDGNKWFGAGQGITCYTDSTWKSSILSDYTEGVSVNHLSTDPTGKAWAISGLGAVFKHDQTWSRYKTYTHEHLGNNITMVYVDKKGNKWIGSTKGLTKFNDTTFQTNSNSPLNFAPNTIAFDAQGNMWFGTKALGVFKFDGTTFTKITVISDWVTSLAIDKDGSIWVATGHGISKINGNTVTDYQAGKSVESVVIDQQGDKWFVLLSEGILKLSGSTWTTYNTGNSGLPDNYVTSVICDSLGNKWFGTNGKGLVKFNGTNWTVYTTANSALPTNEILKMTLDAHGAMWLGTNSRGVCRFDGKSATVYNTGNSGLADHFLTSIACDKKGNVFIGTYYHGLCVLSDTTFIPDSKQYIRGYVYHDKNQNNKRENDENYLSNQKIILLPSKIVTYTNALGEYAFFVDKGSYQLKFKKESVWSATKDSTYTIDVKNKPVLMPEIGVYAPPFVAVNGTLTAGGFRCSTKNVPGWFNYRNEGTTTENGTISLEIDAAMQVVSTVPAADQVTGITRVWNFKNLLPGEERQIQLFIDMPDYQLMGKMLTYRSTITASGNYNKTDNISRILTCSYDPNEKEVNPEGIGTENLTLKNAELNYIVRFQNTGNDYAENVTIVDTLSSLLDITTFKVTGSSHALRTIESDGIVKFQFEQIMLPDSIKNEPGSHGYVSYAVKAKTPVAENAKILNTAYIYFDANPAIITNTAKNTLVTSVVPTEILMTGNSESKFYPNPVHSLLHLKDIEKGTELKVFDVTGQLVLKVELDGEKNINVSPLPIGMYMVQLISNKSFNTYKLIKE